VVLDEIAIGRADAIFQTDPRTPAGRPQQRAIGQLPRRAVGLGRIVGDQSLEFDYLRYQPGQFHDGLILARTDVDPIGRVVQFQQVNQGGRQIVDMQEFTAWIAGSPNPHRGLALPLRFMEAANQGREDMTILRMVVIPGTVKVGRHRRMEHRSILPSVVLAELQASDLGQRVRFIGQLQRRGQQGVFADRLWSQAWINAGAAEEEETLNTEFLGSGDGVDSHPYILD